MFIAALGDPGVGLIEVHRDGIQVLGMGPYAEAWEKNDKARERLKKFRERNAYETRTNGERNANVSGQTQTQTQTQKEETDLPPPAVASAAPEQAGLPGVAPPTPPTKSAKKAREAKKPEAPTDPRHAPLVKALTDEGWPFDGGKDAANVKALLGLADQQEATRGELAGMEVLRRARIAWAQFPGYHSARTLADLRSKWGYFAAPEPPKGGAPPVLDVRRGGVRAELMDHTKPQEPF